MKALSAKTCNESFGFAHDKLIRTNQDIRNKSLLNVSTTLTTGLRLKTGLSYGVN